MLQLPIVVIDEQANPDFVPPEVFAEREGLADEIRTTLAQGIVETLDMGGLTAVFSNCSMSLGGSTSA